MAGAVCYGCDISIAVIGIGIADTFPGKGVGIGSEEYARLSRRWRVVSRGDTVYGNAVVMTGAPFELEKNTDEFVSVSIFICFYNKGRYYFLSRINLQKGAKLLGNPRQISAVTSL